MHRVLASVVVSALSSTLTFGSTMQLTAMARDARLNEIEGVTGSTFASSDPASVVVSDSGLATALFELNRHGAATAAEIADALVDLPVGSQTSSYGSLTGSFTAADILSQGGARPISLDAMITLMDTGDAYVEVRTADFPGGEIRGQIVTVSR